MKQHIKTLLLVLAASTIQAQTTDSWEKLMKSYPVGSQHEAKLLKVEYGEREMFIKDFHIKRATAVETLTTAWAVIAADTIPIFIDTRIAQHLQKGQIIYLKSFLVADRAEYEGIPALIFTGLKVHKYGDE
jgi:hypothetical protein